MSLLTADDYKKLTGDSSADSTAALAAVQEAQGLFENWLHRPLDTAPVTETLRVYADYPGGLTGFSYPSRTPVTSVVIPAPPSAFDRASIRYIGGSFVPGLFFTASPYDPYPLAKVQYIGGYPARGTVITSDVDMYGGTFKVEAPHDLCREIAWAAFGILHPERSLVRDGALVVSTGDSRVQYATARVVNGQLTEDAKKRVARYVRRRVVLS